MVHICKYSCILYSIDCTALIACNRLHAIYHIWHSINCMQSIAQHRWHTIHCMQSIARHQLHSINHIASIAQHRLHNFGCTALVAQCRLTYSTKCTVAECTGPAINQHKKIVYIVTHTTVIPTTSLHTSSLQYPIDIRAQPIT